MMTSLGVRKISMLVASIVLCTVFTSGCQTRQFASSVSESSTLNKRASFLRRKDWPRFDNYISTFGKIPDSSLRFPDVSEYFDFDESLSFIPALEKVFPNANYACLGRDAILVCDILDAFYQNYTGEKRVFYVAASGASFRPYQSQGMSEWLDITKKLLLSSGFDPLPLAKDPKNARPFVLIDATGWQGQSNEDLNMSQARLVLRAAYSLVEDAGGSRFDVVEKLGSLATNDGRGMQGRGFYLTENFDTTGFFGFIREGMKEKFDHPQNTLRMDLRSSSYGYNFWHDNYGPIVVNAKGNAKATPPSYGDPEDRKLLFNRMIALNQYVLSSTFRTELASSADNWGVPAIQAIVQKEPLPVASQPLPSSGTADESETGADESAGQNESAGYSPRTTSSTGFPVGRFSYGNYVLYVTESDDEEMVAYFEEGSQPGNRISQQVTPFFPNSNRRLQFAMNTFDDCNFFEIKRLGDDELEVSWNHLNKDEICKDESRTGRAKPFRGTYTRL